MPPLTGKSSAALPVAGAIAVMVTPACFRAADTAGLTTTSVLLPMTVARLARYLEVAGGLGGLLLVAAGLPAEARPPGDGMKGAWGEADGLQYVEVEPENAPADLPVIFAMHGRGADALASARFT